MSDRTPRHRNVFWPASRFLLLLTGIISLSIGLGGCSAGIGTVERSDVLDAIASAEASLRQARDTELSVSARPSLQQAEAKLAEARKALEKEDGVQALAAAKEAQLSAQQALLLDAQADTFQQIIEKETRRYEAALAETRKEARATQETAREIQRQLQSLRDELNRLRSESERLAAEKRRAEERNAQLQAELSAAQRRVAKLSEEFDRAMREQRLAKQEVEWLKNEMEKAQAALAEAELKARRASRQAESVRQEAREVAEAYSEKVAELERQKQREAALARARQRAAAQTPPPTVSAADLQAAKPVVQTWKTTWEKGDLNAHLRYYAANATGERITVRAGRETRSTWTHSALLGAIREMTPADWVSVRKSEIRAEGDRVVAELAYRKKVPSKAADALDFWVRRAYWDKFGVDWRVVREEWRFYREVPNFPRR